MKKRYLILLALLALTLTCLLSGCGKGEQDLEGMYVATFEINGGKLNLGTSDVTTKINFAYEPGALVMDPTVRIGSGETSSLGYAISRAGYNFTGWYTGPECLPEQKWDFATGTINAEKLTLYAGWEKQIVYTYTVCYTDGANTVALGSYNVKPGATFDDYRKYATLRDDYTPIGYFADAACQTPWDATTVHPGGEQDTDISVFVDIRNPLVFHNHHRPQSPGHHLQGQFPQQRRLAANIRQYLSGHQPSGLFLRQRAGGFMGLAPLLALAFQGDLVCRTVVNPDAELLTGICSVFILLQAAVFT